MKYNDMLINWQSADILYFDTEAKMQKLSICGIFELPIMVKSVPSSGPLFTKKTPSYGYRDPHDKPKTVWRPSQVYNGNPYTDKTVSS